MVEHAVSLPASHWSYEAALLETEQVIRQHSKTFYFATALLPAVQRRAIRALYAFCRASDDLVDCEQTRKQDFEAWQAEVALPSSHQLSPVLASWAHVREQYAIDRTYERDLLEGLRMDLEFRPYATWEDLQTYCYRVASTVGLLSIPIIGLAPEVSFDTAAAPAVQLGIALQLTNILRDIGEDRKRGRIYLPLEDLARFGLTLNDIYQGVYDARFIALMRFEIERARQLYQKALPGIALLSASARTAVAAAAILYRQILTEIEAIDYQVYHYRAHTQGWQKVLMLPAIWWTIHFGVK